MTNKYLNNNFQECAIYRCPEYLYIDDVESFLKDCGDEYVSNGVNKIGVYQWSDDSDAWFIASPNIEKKVREIVEQNSFYQSDNISVKWNVLITLDTNETIKTNSKPVSIGDVHEAIDILLKPSFFGKRIKKFQIVAE